MMQAFRAMIGRCVLSALRDDGAGQVADVTVLAGEDLVDLERIAEYGFSSAPLPGAEGVVLFVGGQRDHGLIVATKDRRTRIKNLAAGEVAIYSHNGDSVVLRNGNVIEVTTQTLRINASTKVEITSPEMVVTASTRVTFTTPLVQTSANLTVGGILSAINGYSLGGALAGGAPSKMTGSITLDGVTLNAINGSTSTWNGKRNDDMHAHSNGNGGANTGTPV